MAAGRVAAIELTADPATLAAVELGPLRL